MTVPGQAETETPVKTGTIEIPNTVPAGSADPTPAELRGLAEGRFDAAALPSAAERMQAQPDPLKGGPLAVEWYDEDGRDTRGRERRGAAFARARERLDGLDLARATDIEAQAAFIEVVRTHPLLGYLDTDGSRTFGSGAKFGRENARRLKSVLDGSDPEALYTPDYREWRALDKERQASLAVERLGVGGLLRETVKAGEVQDSSGGPFLPPPKAPDLADPERRERIRSEYERGLMEKQRGAWTASLMNGLSDLGRDWVRDALDKGEPDARALWLLPEEDRGFALAAWRAARGETDVNALTAGALDAAASIRGMTAGSLGYLNYVAKTTGGRAPSTGPRLASLDAETELAAELQEASAPVFKEYGFGGEAVKGLVCSLPYMLAMSNPYSGTLATLGMAEDARRRLVLEGVDGGTAAGIGLAVGVVNSAIEKMQWEQMTGGGMSELQLRTYGLKAFAKALAKRDLGLAAEAAAKQGRHGVKVWAQELTEEVLQSMAEESGVSAGLGKVDSGRLADAFFDAIEEAAPTTAAFGAVAGSGIGAGGRALARRFATGEAIGGDELAELMRRRLSAVQTLGDAEAAESGRAGELLRNLRDAWRAAPDGKGAVRALESAGLDNGTVALLDDLFRQEAQAAGESSAFRSWYQAEDAAADISPEAVRAISPAFTAAERVSDTETRATLRLADGTEATLLFRLSPLGREDDPERFDAQLRGRVGVAAWDAMGESEREALRSRATVSGHFELATEGAALDADGIITIAAPEGGASRARMGDVYHETFHAATLLASRAGVLTDAQADTLRGLFGDGLAEGERFNEEAAADAYARWLAGQGDDASGAFKAIRDFFRRIYEAVWRKPATREAGAWTVDDVFEAVRSGNVQMIPSAPSAGPSAAAAVAAPAVGVADSAASPVAVSASATAVPAEPAAVQQEQGPGVIVNRRRPVPPAMDYDEFVRKAQERRAADEAEAARAAVMLEQDPELPEDAAEPQKMDAGTLAMLQKLTGASDVSGAFTDGAFIRSGLTPVIEAVYQLGGIRSPGSAEAEAKSKGRPLGAEYDGAPRKLGPGWNRFVYGGSTAPDQAAQELHDAGLLPDAYPDTLWSAIGADVARYNAARANEAEQSASDAQAKVADQQMREAQRQEIRRRAEAPLTGTAGDMTGTLPGFEGSSDVPLFTEQGDLFGRFSLRLNGNPEDIAAAIAAAKMLRGEPLGERSLAQMLRGMGAKADSREVMARAKAVTEGYQARVRQVAESDRELIETLRRDAMERRFFARIDAAAAVGFEEGGEEAKAAVRMQEAKRRAVQREIESAEGFAAATLELEYGVDFAAAVLAAPVPQNGRSDSSSETAQAEALEALLAVTDGAAERPAGAPAAVSAEARAALQRLLDQARQRAERDKEARAEARKRREQTAAAFGEDGSGAGEDGAGGGFGEPTAAERDALALTRREAFEIADAAHFRALIEEMVIARLSKREGFDPARPFERPAALREFALTSRHVLWELAKKLDPSGTREATRLDVERLAEHKRLSALERDIERIFGRIHREMIAETREKLVSKLEADMKRAAGARGQWRRGGLEVDREIEARVEEWARLVLGYLRMSDAEIEAEVKRLDGILSGRRQAFGDGGEAEGLNWDRDFQQAVDRKAALTAYGGLIRRMPGEITDAAAQIMEQIEGGRARLELKRDAFNERTQRMANQFAEAAVNPSGAPMPEPGRLGTMGDALLGLFGLRLRDVVRHSRAETRARALRVIADVEFMLTEAAEIREVYIIKNRERLRDALKTIYGSERAALERLDEKLPEAVRARVSNQGVDMTVGQALQLYGSMMQADYRDNAVIHGRDKQLDALRSVFTDADLALLAWLRGWYRGNRAELDEAYLPVTGLSLQSPSEIYLPVAPLLPRQGLTAKVKAWTPLPPSLTPRVRHRLDFDETVDILTLWDARLSDSAGAIAYAETGIELAAVFGRDHVQDRIKRNHGPAALGRLMSHLTDILRGGKTSDVSEGVTAGADVARAWVARMTLAWNIGSALKQVAAFPAFALHDDVRLSGVLRAAVDVDAGAVRELARSTGFKARYGSGASEEVANALRGERHGWLARAYNAGFDVVQRGDMLAALWIGQGIYRRLTARHIDGGMERAAAARRAMSETWAIIGQTQQSARTENLNAVQRNGGGLGRLVYQFVSSPAQQLAFEVAAVREAIALKGAEGSKERLLRVLFINHVVVPGMMLLATSAWRSLLGYPDDENEDTFWQEVAAYMVAGPASGLFLAGSAGEAGIKALFTGRRDWRSQGLPVENIVELAATVGITARDLMLLDAEALKADVLRLIKSTSAPGRHITQAVQNRAD